MKTANASSVAFDASVARPDGWPTLPEAARYGLAGEVLRIIEPHSEADPAALLIQFLAAVGNLLGPDLHCMVEATRHALLLYPVLVGETAKARKGTSWGNIYRLCELVADEWVHERVTTGLSSTEGLISAVRDDADPPVDRRLLIVQGEYASLLRIMSRDGNTLSPSLRDAWDSGNLRTLVKNDPLKATGAHITVIGHITREELRRYLSNTEAHNGFANRFLWVCAERSKSLPEGGTVPIWGIEWLQKELSGVLQWANEKGKIEIRRDEDARKLWAGEYRVLSQGHPGLLGAATARGEAQVLRLSAIYAVLDCSTLVRVQHLKAALAVWKYCFASARYIFGEATGDPDVETILDALRKRGSIGMTRTEIRDLFNKHRSAQRIEQALNLLSRAGLAKSEHISTSGRDVEKWCATEATKATEAENVRNGG